MANYVIVNKDNEIYEAIDPIEGYFSQKKFRTKKNATAELSILLDEGMLDEEQQWTVDDLSKVKDRRQQKVTASGRLTDLSEMFGTQTYEYEVDEEDTKQLKKLFKEYIEGNHETWNF